MTEKMFGNEALCIVGNVEIPVMCRDGAIRYMVLFHESPIQSDYMKRTITIGLPDNTDQDRKKILLKAGFSEEDIDKMERQRKEKTAFLQGR